MPRSATIYLSLMNKNTLHLVRQKVSKTTSSMSSNLDLPNKRKRTVNPKLLDNDNMSLDAIKRRKVEATKTVTQTQPKPSTSRQASVEVVNDDNDISCHNSGTPTNPNTILESANNDDADVIYVAPSQAAAQAERKEAETEEEPEETDEDELSTF